MKIKSLPQVKAVKLRQKKVHKHWNQSASELSEQLQRKGLKKAHKEVEPLHILSGED